MGIDARMAIEVDEVPDEKTLKAHSYLLAAAHDIAMQVAPRGLKDCPPVNVVHVDAEGDVQKTEVSEAPEQGLPGRRVLEIVESMYQDSLDESLLKAREGKTLIEVSLWCRYYGIGYERGPLLAICNLASHLEYLFRDCTVYYGGDSSGVLVEQWPIEKRAILMKHYYEQAGLPYQLGWSRGKAIEMCRWCEGPMIEFGWGQGKTSFQCPACKTHRMRTDDTGERVDMTEHEYKKQRGW